MRKAVLSGVVLLLVAWQIDLISATWWTMGLAVGFLGMFVFWLGRPRGLTRHSKDFTPPNPRFRAGSTTCRCITRRERRRRDIVWGMVSQRVSPVRNPPG